MKLIFNLICLLPLFSPGFSILKGSPQKCKNEGQKVLVDFLKSTSCISCTCVNGEVECNRQCARQLPAFQPKSSCYLILASKPGECCDRCKACKFNGTEYKSGKEWRNPNNPCRFHSCQAGVITSTNITCEKLCDNPIPPTKDQCCPTCQGCQYNGKQFQDGAKFTLHDPCTECTCKNGNVECIRKACPVLPCPKMKAVLRPGACCPHCMGSRKIFKVENRCLVGRTLYVNGQQGRFDKCTHCFCQNSTMICEKKTCPTLSCSPLSIRRSPDGCCFTCLPERPEETSCVSSGINRKHGDVWKPDLCTKCICKYGVMKCHSKTCHKKVCKKGKVLKEVSGNCCPQCRPKDAICTVFGDPHYQTFDGQIFNFQGSCKYLLTKDCRRGVNSTFMVKVRNDARSSKYFSWTKTVTLKIKDVNIALEQHMVIRVHHKRVKLPFVKLGVVSIKKDGYNVEVRSATGLKVIWDGDSFLELTVPAKYRNHVCGLCGNFNRKKGDDFLMKNNLIATNTADLGQSWRVGSKDKCGRIEPVYHKEPICQKDWSTRVTAVKKCNTLKSAIFLACHPVLSVTRFFQSCLTDMCECPEDHLCYCEALTAYSRACERSGVVIDWRSKTNCENINCPKGATYKKCGPACKKTCRNYQLNKVCRNQCVAGCQCPVGTVMHKNVCIKPENCPVRQWRIGSTRRSDLFSNSYRRMRRVKEVKSRRKRKRLRATV